MSDELQIYQQLNVYTENFPNILEEFKRAYIVYKQSPDSTESEHIFSSKKGLVDSTIKDVNGIIININQGIQSINDNMKTIGEKIDYEKKENARLRSMWNNIIGENNGSDELVDDSVIETRRQYALNVIIIVGCIIVFIFFIILCYRHSRGSIVKYTLNRYLPTEVTSHPLYKKISEIPKTNIYKDSASFINNSKQKGNNVVNDFLSNISNLFSKAKAGTNV
jgi:hypothetical protein